MDSSDMKTRISDDIYKPSSNNADIHPFFSDQHRQLISDTMHFAADYVTPQIDVIQKTKQIPPDLLRHLKATRWLGLLIPSEYGGLGLDCLARILNVQYLARSSSDLGAILQIGQLGTGGLIEFGTQEQKQRWLPALAIGTRVCTIAITEELSGSHVMGMQTSYKKTRDSYILNGEKWFIGNCPIANLHVVYAKSQSNPRTLSAFIVEGERNGVDNSRTHTSLGLPAFPLGKLRLANCEVPHENLLGEEGKGLDIAYYVIANHGRPSLTAIGLGIHHRIMDIATTYSHQRHLYGRPIKHIPSVRTKLFEILKNFEACKHAAYYAAYKHSKGEACFRDMSLAKYLNGEQLCQSCLLAADIFGARVGLPEHHISQLLLDALMIRPPSGTGDVQIQRIMEHYFEEQIPFWEQPALQQPIHMGTA